MWMARGGFHCSAPPHLPHRTGSVTALMLTLLDAPGDVKRPAVGVWRWPSRSSSRVKIRRRAQHSGRGYVNIPRDHYPATPPKAPSLSAGAGPLAAYPLDDRPPTAGCSPARRAVLRITSSTTPADRCRPAARRTASGLPRRRSARIFSHPWLAQWHLAIEVALAGASVGGLPVIDRRTRGAAGLSCDARAA